MEMPCFEICLKLSDMTPWEAAHKKVLICYFLLTAPEVWRNRLAFGRNVLRTWCLPFTIWMWEELHRYLGLGAALGIGVHTLEYLRMLLHLVPTVSCPPEPGDA